MGYRIIVSYNKSTPVDAANRIYKVTSAYLAGDSIPTNLGFTNGTTLIEASADTEAVKLFNDVEKATVKLTNPDGSTGIIDVSKCSRSDHARGNVAFDERYRMAVDRANSMINATCI